MASPKGRLTLRRRTLRRKPCSFGYKDSHFITLLMPAFSLPAAPANLTVSLQSHRNAPLPLDILRFRIPKFGNIFSLVTSSALYLSASELLRFLSRPYLRVWDVSLLRLELSPQPLTPVQLIWVFGVWLEIRILFLKSIQHSTPHTVNTRPCQNMFRGEPAISRFVRHITSNHKSLDDFATSTHSALQLNFFNLQPAHG